MNYTNKTLLELSNIYLNNTVQGWYNATSQKYESHRNGYTFNQNVNVSQKWGYYAYFNATTTVPVNITANPTVTLLSGWNLVGNFDSVAKTLSTLKNSIGVNATQAQYYNRSTQAWVTDDSTSVPVGEAFFVYVTANTQWGG